MWDCKLRTKSITVKITLEEWREIRAVADKENLPITDFIRKALNLSILNQNKIKKRQASWNKQ